MLFCFYFNSFNPTRVSDAYVLCHMFNKLTLRYDILRRLVYYSIYISLQA